MEIPKSAQDIIGKWLSHWRYSKVEKEISPPFLDIACGDNFFKKKLKGGFGVDVTNYGNADIIVKDFSCLPLKADTFNSVAIIASLNYFENPSSVLAECVRVLKPDGLLVITMIYPILGKIWHFFRERWVVYPGFSYQQIKTHMKGLPLHFQKKSRFMLGMNKLYVFKKNE
jgi:SAM-dependent methyltransferase